MGPSNVGAFELYGSEAAAESVDDFGVLHRSRFSDEHDAREGVAEGFWADMCRSAGQMGSFMRDLRRVVARGTAGSLAGHQSFRSSSGDAHEGCAGRWS